MYWSDLKYGFMSLRNRLFFFLALWALVGCPLVLRAEELPDIIQQAAHNQDQSMAVRDRTRYRQQLITERFALRPNQKPPTIEGEMSSLKKLGERTTVVTAEPSLTPDPHERYEVLVRIISDTDDQGQPKPNVDPKSQPGLLVEILWDEIFFPLQEEKLPFLKFDPVDSEDSTVARYHFEPIAQPKTIILASGTVSIDRETGRVKDIHIDSLYNLRSIHKQLAKLDSISADIKFASFRDMWSLPSSATGYGISHLPHLEGFFRFKFQESGYEPVMKIPEP
jgi:hypothetical protein